jgi:hypothetical protein
LDLADGDGLVGEDSPHDSADDDVLQLEHEPSLPRKARIEKPVVESQPRREVTRGASRP